MKVRIDYAKRLDKAHRWADWIGPIAAIALMAGLVLEVGMKPEDKKTWCDALRSGKYKQGTRRLCGDDKWCCIGVAADVLLDDFWIWSERDRAWCIAGNSATLSDAWLKKIDLEWERQVGLVEMNDTGSSFDEIADWIEKNL